MSQREHPRHVEAWIAAWWPWIGLAAGIVIVVVGGIYFTPGAGP